MLRRARQNLLRVWAEVDARDADAIYIYIYIYMYIYIYTYIYTYTYIDINILCRIDAQCRRARVRPRAAGA